MLYRHFCEQLNAYLLHDLPVDAHFVLALSGGVDSRVMLSLLGRFKNQYPNYRYSAVYVHHGLSDNADHWQKQCKNYSQQADIPFYAEKVTLDLGAQVSIEQAARDARYQALSNYIDENSVLLTGQHASDQVETFLLALKRGSGPKGLSAMAELSDFYQGHLLRPFLSISQANIQEYAEHHNLDWIEDESNQDVRFDRNFIRHQITPLLRERWPQIEKTVARSAALCADQEALLQSLLYERLQGMIGPDDSLSIKSLKQQAQPARDALIRMWLAKLGFLMPSEKQLQQLWQDVALAKADAAPEFRYGRTQVGRFDNKLYVFAVADDLSSIVLDWNITTSLMLPDGLGQLSLVFAGKAPELEEGDLAFDLSLESEVQHLQVIFSPSSITAQPETRQHSRKLKKLLQEYKVPTWQRNRIPLLMDGEYLIAALGLFVCKAYSGCTHQLVWHRSKLHKK
ncbi:tRNA lysidine(34) synthetase TilS [Vibrio sp. S17_S38]|uniref:tRNA lysidine(34) synthetase TilS n=1 Tax=Vibrio sp. S17_S38 TaxID=2720229 RepID=UPI001681664A|nr:tRNA lysidine(34) synthetase TilS [Vibrio sp. S17_S38]MBD1572306.1 tRNA lysidine(34) synthetase TilS [Vibrio sp. S17_S38]